MTEVLGRELAADPSLGNSGNQAPLTDTANALRWLRSGLSEETMRLELPPDIRSTVSPIIAALRWGALLFGMVTAATAASDGDLGVVVTLAIALFLTVWRTFRPLRLAWDAFIDRSLPIVDGVIVGGAVGASSGFDSPFIFCLLVAIVVAAFGWGLVSGFATILGSLVAMGIIAFASGDSVSLTDVGGISLLLVMAGGVLLSAFIRDNLIERQREEAALNTRVDMLTETNEMLGILNQVARTLPESMDMSEAVNATQRELTSQFDAETIGLVVRDEATSRWLPMITQGCDFKDTVATSDLPEPMQRALLGTSTLTAGSDDSIFVGDESGSGLYTALKTRGKVIGLLAVENDRADSYGRREVRILDGLSGALALTIDNVRSFGRLRTVGADQERTRIARDLHDRLGQWLTYISMELERIMGDGPESKPLQSLYGDVQTAIDELRETLRQLRTKVSDKEALEVIGPMMTERFEQRTGTACTFSAVNPGQSMLVNIENELLRILQEALNNVEKHARATQVDVAYEVDEGKAVLTITDNGKGFNTSGAVRDTSYGLMGMRERADVIGATLKISSEKGQGTTIQVRASNELGI